MESGPLTRDDLREVVFLLAGIFLLLQAAVWLGNAWFLTTFERPCQVSLGCINGLSANVWFDLGLGLLYAVVGVALMVWTLRINRRRRET